MSTTNNNNPSSSTDVEQEKRVVTTTIAASGRSTVEEQQSSFPDLSPDPEAEISRSLKLIQEESLQISELATIERNYTQELCSMVRNVLEPLHKSIQISPDLLSTEKGVKVNAAVLTAESLVVVTQADGMVSSKPLESYPTDVVIQVVTEAIPRLGDAMQIHRQRLSGRVSLLERLTREFRKLSSAFTQASQMRNTASGGGGISSSKGSTDAVESALMG
jgi:hypothetical protein